MHMNTRRVRVCELQGLLSRLALAVGLSGCATTRFVNKPRGATVYAVRLVNDCTRGTANVYFDGEYRNKGRLDVKPRKIAHGEAKVFELAEGRHNVDVELLSFTGSNQLARLQVTINKNSELNICN